MNKQKYIDKFMAAFFILAVFKLIGILAELFHKSFWSVVGTLLLFLVIAFIIFMVLTFLKDKEKASSGRNRSGRGSAFVESTLFDKLRNKYEEMAGKYIDEKDYIRAAKIYMNLLQDHYRGAKTLEDGGLYNEAAVVYLKKLKNKSEAARCYEKANQLHKSIDLYKELGHKEKVGDLYKQLNDAKNANVYYQMVADDYVSNNQMVKGSLVYRKKMEMPEAAQQILLKGWDENKDAFNCLNNYFVNISNVDELNTQIKKLYESTPAEKKLIYLEAMKHEFKKDQKLQAIARNIAYEIIAENVDKSSSVINELKFFNPSDDIILKDISRYKTGKNRIFRN